MPKKDMKNSGLVCLEKVQVQNKWWKKTDIAMICLCVNKTNNNTINHKPHCCNTHASIRGSGEEGRVLMIKPYSNIIIP